MPENPNQSPGANLENQIETTQGKPELDQFETQLEALKGMVDEAQLRESFMRDLDELGITDEAERQEHWNLVKQEMAKRTVENSGQIENINGFVDDVENLDALKPIIASNNPIESLAEAGFFETVWSYFMGEEKDKKEASKKLLAMVAGFFGLKNLFGAEEAEVAQSETSEEATEQNESNAEIKLDNAENFVTTYKSQLDLSKEGSAQADYARLEAVLAPAKIKELDAEAAKENSKLKGIYLATQNKLGEAINPSVFDIRLQSLEEVDAIKQAIQEMADATPQKIRDYLDNIDIFTPPKLQA